MSGPARILCRQCRTCPFLPGNERLGWHEGARTALLAGLDDWRWFMEYHEKERAACAGFVRVLGPESISVRLAVIRGRLRPLRPGPGMAQDFAELDARAAGAPGWT